PDGLGVAELANAQAGQFAAVAGALDAAEAQLRAGHRHPVDEHLAGLDVVDEALLLGLVVGPGVGPQPEGGGVGDLDGLVDVGGAVWGGDRAEHLFGVERHVLGDLGDPRRRVEPTRPVGSLSAATDLRASGDGVVDLLGDFVAARFGGQRAHVGVRVGRV